MDRRDETIVRHPPPACTCCCHDGVIDFEGEGCRCPGCLAERAQQAHWRLVSYWEEELDLWFAEMTRGTR